MENEFDYRKYLNLIAGHKRLFAITALAIMSSAVALCYLMPKKYEAQSTFFVEKNVLSELLSGPSSRSETEDALKGLNYSIKSRSLFLRVINDLDLNLTKKSDEQLEGLILSLQKDTDCKLNKEEGLITISFTNTDPRLARDFVNALVRRYIEQNLSTKREETYGATSFLSDQVASAKDKIDKVEKEIAGLRSKYGAALDITPGTVPLDTGAGRQRLDELLLRRTQLEATRKQLLNSNPAKVRLAALQRRLEELRVEYTDNYPEIIKVKADIEAARNEANRGTASIADPQELARVEAELSAVKMSEASQRAINSRSVMQANPAARAALDSLLQEKTSLRAAYDQLVGRQNQAEMTKQMAVQDKSTTFRIVDPAIMPLGPVSPNRVRIILMGIAAGIAGGLGILLLLDFFNNSIKMVNPLKTLAFPVLAVIPLMKSELDIQIERRRDLRLYFLSACWFSIILMFLLMEILHMSFIDRLITNLLSSQ